MGEISDIKDRESLRLWLEGQPREVSVWIASRAAARVLPVWWAAVLTEDWARKGNLTALSVMRSLLISSVAAWLQSDEIGTLASRAATFADSDADVAATSVAGTFAARSAAALFSGRSAATVADDVLFAVRSKTMTWTPIRADAEHLQAGRFPDGLPLWPNRTSPLAETWEAIKARVTTSDDAESWIFWIAWYDSLLDGCPMLGDAARTREMLERIALIDADIWDNGPAAVNPVIREIWELHRLRAEVAVLQSEKDAVQAARASEMVRGHNQPPEGLVGDAPKVARQITIIWAGLDEAREELGQELPDRGRLHAVAERMLSTMAAITRYCGKLADTSSVSAAKWSGPVVGTAILDQIVNNGRLMQFVRDLFDFAAGG